jgi:5-methylcytosine-specific restriction endonuclease McrA
MSNGIYPVWIHKGHLWVTSHDATTEDVTKKATKFKPRYSAKDQWWWTFTDPFLRGMMENMDRQMLGLKQQHDKTWKALTVTKKRHTRKKVGHIGVRDNRYIPQWVKIHVVLRDKGRCVYCGKDDPKELEFDHRRAWSKGGSSKDPLNICLGCKGCNRSKGARDWGWG